MATISDNRVVLVTGASHGIGLEVVRQLAERGLTVILTARDTAKAEAATKQLAGLSVLARPMDILSDESVNQLAAQIDKEFGALDILVNNAAAFADWTETASKVNLQTLRDTLETNLVGTWRVTMAFLPLIRKSKHGRIVNVSSGMGSHDDGRFGLTNAPAASYPVSKAAINAFTSKLAAELAGTGILVNSVCPGLTATYPGMETMGGRPVSDGAASVVWTAVLPDNGPSGGFFRDGQLLPW